MCVSDCGCNSILDNYDQEIIVQKINVASNNLSAANGFIASASIGVFPARMALWGQKKSTSSAYPCPSRCVWITTVAFISIICVPITKI